MTIGFETKYAYTRVLGREYNYNITMNYSLFSHISVDTISKILYSKKMLQHAYQNGAYDDSHMRHVDISSRFKIKCLRLLFYFRVSPLL